MVEVQLEPELEARLEKLAAENHVSQSFFVREALERFIEDRGLPRRNSFAGRIHVHDLARGDGAKIKCGGLGSTMWRSVRCSGSTSLYVSASFDS